MEDNDDSQTDGTALNGNSSEQAQPQQREGEAFDRNRRQYADVKINRSEKRRFMPILDSYILKKFLGTFFYSIALIIIIVIVFDISEKVEDFVKPDGPVAHQIIFDYYCNFIPFFVNLFSPLFTFISVIFFTSRMAARTEIVAMLSGGISFRRLLRPYLIGATIIATVSLFLNNFIIPISNKTRLDFESRYIGARKMNTDRNIHRQTAPGELVYVETYNTLDSIGYHFSLEKYHGYDMQFKLMAEDMRWDSKKKRWKIRNYNTRRIDYTHRIADAPQEILGKGRDTTLTINLSPSDFDPSQSNKETMTTPELMRYIANEKMKGSGNVQYYEIELHKRIAFPFATFFLTLIGVSLSSRKVRGGIGLHLGLGIAIAFAYILFMQVSTSFGQSGTMPPWLAVWMPNLIFGGLCFYLMRRAPK